MNFSLVEIILGISPSILVTLTGLLLGRISGFARGSRVFFGVALTFIFIVLPIASQAFRLDAGILYKLGIFFMNATGMTFIFIVPIAFALEWLLGKIPGYLERRQ